MKLTKMWLDTEPLYNPKGSTRENRNVVNKAGIFRNEEGFFNNVTGYHNGLLPIGYIEGDTFVVIFSYKGTRNFDEIGIIENNTYTTIKRYDFKFNPEYPIHGALNYNYKKERIIAFNDRLNELRILNIDSLPSPFSLDAISFFPKFNEPKFNLSILESSGNLKSGAYYLAFSYIDSDNNETACTTLSRPVFLNSFSDSVGFDKYVGNIENTTTGKSIKIDFTSLDDRYSKVKVYAVHESGGIKTAYEGSTYNINENIIIISSLTNQTDLEKVLMPPVNYKNAYGMDLVDSVLYLSGVEEVPVDLGYQKYANNIKLQYTTKLKNTSSLNESSKKINGNYEEPTFAHGEVYAFYIVFKLKNGGRSVAYHIPAELEANIEVVLYDDSGNIIGSVDPTRTVQSIYDEFSPTNNVEYLKEFIALSAGCRLFQVTDTTNRVTATSSNLGFWFNENEYYPSAANDTKGDYYVYDSNNAQIGYLHEFRVMHHVFPTVQKVKEWHYSGNSDYGKTVFDTLGVKIVDTSLYIPDSIKEQVTSYELYFAKRDGSNNNVIGQDLLLHNVRRTDGGGVQIGVQHYSVGANNNLDFGNPVSDRFKINRDYIRLHSFDMFRNRPSLLNTYIDCELKFRFTPHVHNAAPAYPANVATETDYACVHRNDILHDVTSISAPTPINKVRKLNSYSYIPNNVVLGNDNNNFAEECVVAELNRSCGADIDLTINTYTYSNTLISTPAQQDTYLMTIKKYNTDCYLNFRKQLLVRTGVFYSVDTVNTHEDTYKGDSVLSYHSFITYGLRNSGDVVDSQEGLKIIYRFLGVHYHNPDLRHYNPAIPLSLFYRSGEYFDFIEYAHALYRTDEPNNFSYDRSYSAKGDLVIERPYDYTEEFLSSFPYRFVRSKGWQEENKEYSWKKFYSNEYYEMPKEHGVIVRISSVGNDLLIHQKNCLSVSSPNVQIDTDSQTAFLGSGNILKQAPVPVLTDENGLAGLQHRYFSGYCKYGYYFGDASTGQIFLYSGSKSLKELSSLEFGLFYKCREVFKDLTTSGVLISEDNPFSQNGFVCEYDEKYDRLIFAKKKFTLTSLGQEVKDGLVVGKLLDNSNGSWYLTDVNISLTPIPIAEEEYPDYFLNECETMSFTFGATNGWSSFHDYIPSALFKTRTKLLSINNKKFYLHNTSVGKFYNDASYESKVKIVDVVGASQDGKMLSGYYASLFIMTKVLSTTEEKHNHSVSTLKFLNSYQESDTINISIFDKTSTPANNYLNSNLRKNKNSWSFNKIRAAGSTYLDKRRFIDKFIICEIGFNNQLIDSEPVDFYFIFFEFVKKPLI